MKTRISLRYSREQEDRSALGNYRLLGDRHLITPNDPNGLTLIYYLKDQPKEKVTFTITGAEGKTLRTIEGTNKAGINRVVFQLGGLRFPARFRRRISSWPIRSSSRNSTRRV